MTTQTTPEPQLEPDDEARPRRLVLLILALVAIAAVVVGVVAASLRTNEADTGGIAVPELPNLGGAVPTGDPAQDFTVDLLDGTVFNLDAHLADDGRPVFLNLWASWCTPCRQEMPAIQAASERWPGVFFLGVAVEDDPRAAEAFAAEIGVTYALAIDEKDVVNVAFPHFGLPATYVIASDGTVANQAFGEVNESQIDTLLAGAIG